MVLVVHSSKPVRNQLRARLQKEPGLLVIEAATGTQALELFFHHRPAAALVHVCLPDGSGFEVLRCIRQAAPDCALILLRDSADPFVEQVARLVGAAEVCHRPDDPACIRQLLETLGRNRPPQRPERAG